jgi:hypothetical protein
LFVHLIHFVYITRRYDFPQLLALPNVLICDQNQA